MARPLGEDEKALWGRVIASVRPIHRISSSVKAAVKQSPAETVLSKPAIKTASKPAAKIAPTHSKTKLPVKAAVKLQTPPPRQKDNLDGHWDRRIGKGAVIPDVSIDLHGTGLSGAYTRLDGALEQAIAQQMRVILLVTGKPRNHDRHSGAGRGAIASVVRDWLAASRHAGSIAAVRNAHPRHGGSGALYIILKR